MSQESWSEETAGCQPPEAPVFCKNNCGFFGSDATMNLCSKCYRDLVLKQSHSAVAISNAEVSAVQAVTDLFVDGATCKENPPESVVDSLSQGAGQACVKLSAGEATSSEACAEQPVPNGRPNRCLTCKKRVGLMGFKCRCGDVFCTLHRYSDTHSCTYDYKANGREAISKANPVVKAEKITKI